MIHCLFYLQWNHVGTSETDFLVDALLWFVYQNTLLYQSWTIYKVAFQFSEMFLLITEMRIFLRSYRQYQSVKYDKIRIVYCLTKYECSVTIKSLKKSNSVNVRHLVWIVRVFKIYISYLSVLFSKILYILSKISEIIPHLLPSSLYCKPFSKQNTLK